VAVVHDDATMEALVRLRGHQCSIADQTEGRAA
jgi:hypothetical protein